MRPRVTFLSFHTCPLLQPGRGWAGGMNVYVDELSRALARDGIQVDVFTRRHDSDAASVTVEPGLVVHHIDAGPPRELDPARSVRFIAVFADEVMDRLRSTPGTSVVHSHYWLSGWAGLKIKRETGLAHIHSSHTLGRVREARALDNRPPDRLVRLAAEQEVIGEADAVIASTEQERSDLIDRYGADRAAVSVIAPGVDHDLFIPGDRTAARIRLGWPDVPTLLFVGRVQSLKGPDVAVEAMAGVAEEIPDARLVVVGAPSGERGARHMDQLHERVKTLDMGDRVTFAEPVAHRLIADVYRAADLVLVPSRSESFGLVAVEAQACGVPVLASGVGGLATVVGPGSGGMLVQGWGGSDWAAAALRILGDEGTARVLSSRGPGWAMYFSWEGAVESHNAVYDGLR